MIFLGLVSTDSASHLDRLLEYSTVRCCIIPIIDRKLSDPLAENSN